MYYHCNRWQIEAVSLVERLPIIFPFPPKWELDFEMLQGKVNHGEYGKEYPQELWDELAAGERGNIGDAFKQAKKGGAKGKEKAKEEGDGKSKKKKDAVQDAASASGEGGEDDDPYGRDVDFEGGEEGEDEDVKKEEDEKLPGLERLRLEDFEIWPEGIEFLPKDFTPMPRITEDDINKNMRSLNRALDRRLYLIVKGEYDGEWQFLRGVWDGDDSECLSTVAHDAATAMMREHPDCDYRLQLHTYHHAPAGAYYRELPLETQKELGVFGAKQFFYHTYLLDGAPEVQMLKFNFSDYAWVDRHEMKDYLEPDYYAYVKDMLVDF
jgi:hypothetical protein